MEKLTFRRLFAFAIDYVIIAIYGLLLWGLASIIDPVITSPYTGQLVGFISLTLPVFMYFFLSERSPAKATVGKRALRLTVISTKQVNYYNILVRNLLKFIPWEIAHIGVHWLIFYSDKNAAPPIWIWLALILPQAILLGYLISLFYNKGEYTVYDRIARTNVGDRQ